MARFSQRISPVVCALWLLCASAARAQNAPPAADDCTRDRECDRHYLQARTLSTAGQFIDALDEYHAAYAIQPVPTLLFNIARLNHKLGRLKEAASAYEAYLRQDIGSDPALKEKAKEYLSQIPTQSEPLVSSPQAVPIPPIAPAEHPEVQLMPFRPPPPPPSSSERSFAFVPVYQRWWLWTAVGAVVLGGTLAIVIGTQVDFRPKPSEIIDLRGQL